MTSCHDYLSWFHQHPTVGVEKYIIICPISGEPKTGYIQVKYKLPSSNVLGNTITDRSTKNGWEHAPECTSKSQSSILPKAQATGDIHRVNNVLTLLLHPKHLDSCQASNIDCWLYACQEHIRKKWMKIINSDKKNQWKMSLLAWFCLSSITARL